jgi:hypothetical protein
MKQLILLTFMTFIVLSCKKKEEPTPSDQDGKNNNNPSFTTKTVEFYLSGSTGSDIAVFYVGEDQVNPTYRGSLMGYPREKTSACIEPHAGGQIQITHAGRYYYESRKGLISTGFTTTHAGYFDVASNGKITITQTMQPSSPGVLYEDCPDEECFTVYY